MSLLEKNINKNLQNPTDDKDAIMDIAAKNLVREVSARLRLLEEFSGSKYRNCISKDTSDDGSTPIHLKITPDKYKEFTLDILFSDDCTSAMMYVLDGIQDEFSSDFCDICSEVNTKIFKNEANNLTFGYSYGFSYENGMVFGRLPGTNDEISKDFVDCKEVVKSIDRLIYYAETDLIPLILAWRLTRRGTPSASTDKYKSENRKMLQSPLKSSANMNLDFTKLDLYYQKEFQEIYETGETYKGKFNWWPFLFGGIWALYKGLWKSALVWLVASIATGGIAGLACGIYLGFRGNYLYYHKYVYHKEILF